MSTEKDRITKNPDLLVDITVGMSPAKQRIIAWSAIDSRLTVDSQEAELIQFGQARGDDGSFARRGLVRPGRAAS